MDNDTLSKVLLYVDEHIYEKISLNSLAETAGYSPFYFSKLFSETMGMPVTGYIRIRKLQYALTSLIEGQKILDVAILYAFDSHEGFTRSFTQLFGSTPRTVRKFLTSYTVPNYSVKQNGSRIVTMKKLTEEEIMGSMQELALEVLNESLKEAKAGFCTKIEVYIYKDGHIKIKDNGRGIPLSKDIHASKAVLDKILSGSPITNAQFSEMGDFIDVGLQTVNSLCECLHVTVNRGDNIFVGDYIRGVAQHDVYVKTGDSTFGTEMFFKPDTAIFGDAVFSGDTIREYLEERFQGINSLEFSVKTEE